VGLTSIYLQVAAIVAAVACFVLVVWLWPRLSGRGWRPVLGRVGLLLANQLLILLALALGINTYFGFYSSWGDLFGTGGPPGTIVEGQVEGSGAGSVLGPDLPTATVRVLSAKVNPLMLAGADGASGGTLQTVDIGGGRTGLTVPGYVYLPPEYSQPEYAGTRFPVVVVLTGYPGEALNLITRMKYPTLAAQAIYERQMPPTVLVLLRPTVAPPRDTECQDVPNGPQAESFFVADLPQAMQHTYRVSTDPTGWGVIGDSTGGYCALKFAMQHPEAYRSAVSLSGYYQSAVDLTTGDLFGGSQDLRNDNDLMWRLTHLPDPPVSVLVTSSLSGESDLKATEAFVAAVKAPMRVAHMYLASGGHNFATWDQELPGALRWLGQHLQSQ
jgi:S-formylglutathione hydrolase FrmB